MRTLEKITSIYSPKLFEHQYTIIRIKSVACVVDYFHNYFLIDYGLSTQGTFN